MKYWIVAALFAAACASPETAQSPPQTQAASTQSSGNTDYSDARSHASDADITVARRSYRASCQRDHSVGWCECMTGGMAQALSPADLTIAIAGFTGRSVPASAAARTRIAAAQAQSEQACTGAH